MDRIGCDFEVKFADGAPDGTFSGYGAVFGNEDLGGDVIVKGAFRQTLADWRKKNKLPKMLFQHGSWADGDSMLPIGVWTEMEEDDHGLKVTGRLFALDTDRSKTIYAGLKEGAIDELSIGYRAKEYVVGTKPSEPYRTIKRLDLREVSVVIFAMNDRALINSVKGALPSERQFEDWLVRDAGFSRSQAKTIIASGFKSLRSVRDAAGSEGDLVEVINRATQTLRQA